MNQERTLVLIKPDAVQRGLIGTLIARFEAKGLTVEGCELQCVDRERAVAHYAPHRERPFFEALVAYVTGAPVVALALRGDGVIATVRRMVGTTDGREAAAGTIRGDFGVSPRYNLVHASDSATSAERELALWFPQGFVSWERCDRSWLDLEA